MPKETMKTVRIFILLAAPITAAHAACWEKVSETNDSTRYIDVCSIVKDGPLKKAWIKSEYSITQSTDDFPAKPYVKTLQLNYYNCAKRQDAATQGIYYGESDKIVKTESISLKRVTFVDSPPGTVGEVELNYVCKHRPGKPSTR